MSKYIKLSLAALAVCVAFPVLGDSHKPAFGGDFTFRKLKPPSGSGNRITVQIDPETANPFPEDPEAAAAPSSKPSKHLEWFWTAVSPAIGTPLRGRFAQAVAHVDKAPADAPLPQPRLDALHKIAAAHGTDIIVETLNSEISPALVLAVIAVESGGRIAVESPKGAQGLMQLIPDTAERFGVTDATDPKQNIKGGVAYLKWLMKEFNGDPILALAGYNAGEGAVRKYEGVPPFAETRAYVPKVLAAWNVARSICLTPPELVSDGCVFRPQGTL
ncbi:MAG: lytic transglycosylase domain-containing protein [Litoreibacter sp.]|nr:lytic transglycosylase domain-containing protein [Litoreibacter sp.]